MSITPITRVRVEERLPDLAAALPVSVHLDSTDTPAEVLDALALAAFTEGREPHARSASIERIRIDAVLVPEGARTVRSVDNDGFRRELAVGEGWTLRVLRRPNQWAHLSVTAVTDELARAVLDAAVDGAAEPVPVDDSVVTVGFWHLANGGHPRRNRRSIAAPEWSQVRGNYAAATADAFDRLLALTLDEVPGRLILLHGAPGTGKTTALRALARAWRPWCQTDCVLDPDRLFHQPGYLMDVAVGHQDEGDQGTRRWRLLLLEDCDELIRGEAKAATGQGLSRLLNLTDGLLGQGRDVLVAITTNEDLARLHPAVVRPGRCLARIEVGPLPYQQAVAWLGTASGVGPGGATLAELYALRSGAQPVAAYAAPEPSGCYL